jgi:ABC-type amino acid transport substrate-binding protein
MKTLKYILMLFAFNLNVTSLESKELVVMTECDQPCKLRAFDKFPDSLPTSIVLEMFKITKDTPKILVMPWARAYDNALTDKNVLIYSIAKTEKREKLFEWVGDILIERYFVWSLKSPNQDSVAEAVSQNFKNQSFATYRGSNEFDYISQMPNIKLYSVVYPNQRIQMVLANRVDYFIENEQTLKESCLQMAIDCERFQKVTEIKSLSTPLSIAINKNSDPALIKQYQTAFSSLLSSGKLKQLVDKWKIN